MDDAPEVGTVLVARFGNRAEGGAYFPAGTHFEVIDVEEAWDNRHAMIFIGYEYRLKLRVVDGPAAGKHISVREQGTFVTTSGPDSWPQSYPYPGWLEFASQPPILEQRPSTGSVTGRAERASTLRRLLRLGR